MMNKNAVGRGVAYLYIEAITMMFSGYIYWLILSKITSPSVIGTSSTAISFITIFMTVALIGVGGGIQRFLGKSLVEKKIENTRGLINSALLIVGTGILISSIVILVFKDWIYYSFKIDLFLSVVSILIMGLSTMAGLLRSILIPSLKIKVIAISSILSTIIKILVTVILVLIGTGVIGILMGFMISSILTSIILTVEIKKTYYNSLTRNNKTNVISLFHSTKDIVIASMGFWIPGVITSIGSQLGTIFVFISNGANHAGVYFISFSIVTGLSMIMSVLSTIAYPAISSMKDGRKRAIWRLIKVSLIITLPISNIIIFYSSEIMQLFGSNYTTGASNLDILLLSIFPTSLISGIGILVYAYGNNRLFLVIGLFTSIPRTLLYFIFVPIFGGNGAALTYTMGSIIGCIVSLIIANKMGLKIFWKQIILISIIPTILIIVLRYSGLNYIIGLCVSLVISYILFLKLRIIDTEEIQDISKILPEKIANPLVNLIIKISNKLNK
jgi:O-antigen/teichoic acid export membrane protein